jgi:hypothetical protein
MFYRMWNAPKNFRSTLYRLQPYRAPIIAYGGRRRRLEAAAMRRWWRCAKCQPPRYPHPAATSAAASVKPPMSDLLAALLCLAAIFAEMPAENDCQAQISTSSIFCG